MRIQGRTPGSDSERERLESDDNVKSVTSISVADTVAKTILESSMFMRNRGKVVTER